MAVIVTLDYFSGIPNPQWTLTPAQVRDFKRRFAALPAAPGEIPPAFPMLGYGGLQVSSTQGELPEIEVMDGRVQEVRRPSVFRFRTDSDRKLEQWLLDATMPPAVLEKYALTFTAVTKQRNEQPILGLPAGGPMGGLRCATAPAFAGNVSPWTNRLRGNNCYAYANNDPAPTSKVPMPGRRDTNINHTAAELMEGAKQDRLELVAGNGMLAACPAGEEAHYLVICLREQTGQARDFHCLRLDADGAWSHKDGRKRVRKTDDTGNAIADLRNARFKDQMQFVGVFVSIKGVRRIFQA